MTANADATAHAKDAATGYTTYHHNAAQNE